MICKRLITRGALIVLGVVSQATLAGVSLYSFSPCEQLWRKDRSGFFNQWTEALERGRHEPSQEVATEVLAAVDHVYQTYDAVLTQAKKPKDFIAQFLAELRAEDARTDPTHTRYFVYRNVASGEIEGVARLILSAKDSGVSLPVDRLASGSPVVLPAGNRAEIGRLATVPRPGRTPISKELAYAAATYLKEKFPDNDYTLYANTDAPRARLYQREYNFEVVAHPKDLQHEGVYILRCAGEKFFDIYVGHLSTAYALGIEQRDHQKATELVERYRQLYHLKDYIPSQNALVHLAMIHSIYQGRGVARTEIEEMLRTVDQTRENLDFVVIFLARAIYDLQTTAGEPARALQLVQQYVESAQANLASGAGGQASPAGRLRMLLGYLAIYQMHNGDFANVVTYRQRLLGPEVDGSDRDRFLRAVQSWEERFHISFPTRSWQDDPVIVNQILRALNDLLEPSRGDFASFTNPYFFRLKGELLMRSGYLLQGQKLSLLSLGLVLPGDRLAFDAFWAQRN